MIQLDLGTLHYILQHFSEDIANDCCKIIAKLIKSLSVSMLCESKFFDEKIFTSISVLLNLYDSIKQNDANTNLELPVSNLVENLKYIFQCSDENCNLYERDVQLNLLSAVSSVFKNGLLQNSSRNVEELVQFYNYSITCISASVAKKECKSDCLIFKLKIITLLYQALAKIAQEPLLIEMKKLKLINDSRECELFLALALHEDDGIAFQTLLHLIPAQIMCFKSAKVVEVIWKQISSSFTCYVKNSRVLIILCQIFDLCFSKSILKDKVDLTLLLFEDINYWKLIQFSLVEKDPVKRKQGLYLFKNSIDILNRGNKNLLFGKDENVFYWDINCKDELFKIFSEIILTLEFLEEQQIHIIKPIFKLIETVVKNILDSNTVNFSWILVVYKKALLHESLQVVKWGLSGFLKLPENFFSDNYIARETAELLAVTLNNMSLYYNNGLAISNELTAFFIKVTKLSTCKNLLSLFIKELCSQVWSAEALFFVTHSLTGIRKCSLWGKEEIYEISKFVLKAFKTHNKIIRAGVQSELLNVCLNLTDEKAVPLENIIFLISVFFERDIIQVGSKAWNNLKCLLSCYSKQDAENILETYVMKKPRNEPKYMSLILILFFYIYDLDYGSNVEYPSFESHEKNFFAMKFFQEILLSYKEIHKRPYCDKLIHDQNLLIICSIYKANLKNSVPEFVKPTLPFLKDVLLYIQTQISQISDLQDINECELYLDTFENIVKTLALFNFDMEFTNHLYMEILKELESCTQSNASMCSVGMFWRIKLLHIVLKLHIFKPVRSFLDFYLLKAVNEPLMKSSNYSDNTRDFLTLWGKMNSEFLEQKWEILEYLIDRKLVLYGRVRAEGSCWISNDDLARLCVEALDTGGYGILSPVASVLKNVLPVMEDDLEVRKIIHKIWKLIMERKKTEEFKVFIQRFVEMVFQDAFIQKGDSVREILLEYSDFVFSDSSLAVVNIFMKHIQQMEGIVKSVPLFCHIIGKGLIFGPVEKRDERLTNTVCSHIEFLKICDVHKISDYNTSNEIRARAVHIILKLDRKCPLHQTIARQMIDTLLKMEKELNKNRSRHFGNSHVHRVKHRLMQALLLLEPMLSQNEDQAIKLSEWVIQCLVSENSQPSVRYMQEWLLVRLIVRHPEVYCRFHISAHCSDTEENKKRGACSLIAVSYHSCQLIHSDLMECRIASDLFTISKFCFHRHFELRLYAQVVLMHLYEFAISRKLDKVIQEYKEFYEALRAYLEQYSQKNKNLFNLANNFYFKHFHPLNNYNLETIYMDLPRLTNVGPDEWISVEMFSYCGVDYDDTNVSLKDSSFSLKFIIGDHWLLKSFNSPESPEFDDEKSEKFLDNYQKKITPIKSLIPCWNENSSCGDIVSKDGLIVVASLIDRIPNLGGLARTCEVFGASEYVINSLRHTEDKQFTSLSVTAEKWITIKEVKVQDLLDYVSEMKQNGYTIIGAEQALRSHTLNSVKFPRKSLLLLGNEKEGIPPNLLPFLDICVEVPQLGLIRSLNVHVTGALFIWEYAKQHNFS